MKTGNTPDQQTRDRSAPDQAPDPIIPSPMPDGSRQDQAREERDQDVVFVLEAHDRVRLQIGALDELETGIDGFAEDPAAMRPQEAVCGRVGVVGGRICESAYCQLDLALWSSRVQGKRTDR